MVAGSLLEFGALVALLAGPLGILRGFLVALAAVAAVDLTYLGFIRPWQVHWGATGGGHTADAGRRHRRAQRPVHHPGRHDRCACRPGVAVADPAGLWAGRLVHHWPGNGGQPGIGQTGPEPGQQGSRDPVRMMPASGFEVVQVEDGHYFVASAPDQAMSWCPDLEPLDQHSCR